MRICWKIQLIDDIYSNRSSTRTYLRTIWENVRRWNIYIVKNHVDTSSREAASHLAKRFRAFFVFTNVEFEFFARKKYLADIFLDSFLNELKQNLSRLFLDHVTYPAIQDRVRQLIKPLGTICAHINPPMIDLQRGSDINDLCVKISSADSIFVKFGNAKRSF